MKENINYNKLRQDVLEELVCSRMIECKDNRTDMVRQLNLDDEEKHIRKTTVEKQGDSYLIGVDIANKEDSKKMGKLIEKFEAQYSHYAWGKIYYISKKDINELD